MSLMEEQRGKEGLLMLNHFLKIGDNFVLDRLVGLSVVLVIDEQVGGSTTLQSFSE